MLSFLNNNLKACPDLRELSLISCKKVTDKAIQDVCKSCKQITRLRLSGDKITDNTLDCVGKHCSFLGELYLGSCSSVTENGLALALFGLPQTTLTRLTLIKCVQISEEAAFNIFGECPKLKHISVVVKKTNLVKKRY